MNIHPPAQGFEPVRSKNSRRGFVSEFSYAVRGNPVPAALIGMGVLWMFLGGGSRTTLLGGASRSLLSGLGQASHQMGRTAYRGAEGIGAGMSSAASGVAETIKEAGSLVRSATRSAADAAGETLSEVSKQAAHAAKAAYETTEDFAGRAVEAASRSATSQSRSVSDTGSEVTSSVQNTLAEMFQKQPLLLGAVGLAVGAAIAASIPATDAENRLMGETADSVKEQAQDFVTEKSKQAEAMATKGLAEAKAQGLTPAAAGEALRGVTENLAGVAEKAGRGVSRKLNDPGPKGGPGSPLR